MLAFPGLRAHGSSTRARVSARGNMLEAQQNRDGQCVPAEMRMPSHFWLQGSKDRVSIASREAASEARNLAPFGRPQVGVAFEHTEAWGAC